MRRPGYARRVNPDEPTPDAAATDESGRPAGGRLLASEVHPLDVDGVRTVLVGILVWAAALLGLLPFASRLRAAGMEWWLWTCVTGIVLGLVGLAYCRWRRDRMRQDSQARSRQGE
nr:DUF2530 domain-containing protein [Actinopolymorpha cephalotaxi]